MTWDGASPGRQLPGGPGGASPMSAPHTTQVCLTQAMIDKYGGPMPQSRSDDCHVSNVQPDRLA